MYSKRVRRSNAIILDTAVFFDFVLYDDIDRRVRIQLGKGFWSQNRYMRCGRINFRFQNDVLYCLGTLVLQVNVTQERFAEVQISGERTIHIKTNRTRLVRVEWRFTLGRWEPWETIRPTTSLRWPAWLRLVSSARSTRLRASPSSRTSPPSSCTWPACRGASLPQNKHTQNEHLTFSTTWLDKKCKKGGTANDLYVNTYNARTSQLDRVFDDLFRFHRSHVLSSGRASDERHGPNGHRVHHRRPNGATATRARNPSTSSGNDDDTRVSVAARPCHGCLRDTCTGSRFENGRKTPLSRSIGDKPPRLGRRENVFVGVRRRVPSPVDVLRLPYRVRRLSSSASTCPHHVPDDSVQKVRVQFGNTRPEQVVERERGRRVVQKPSAVRHEPCPIIQPQSCRGPGRIVVAVSTGRYLRCRGPQVLLQRVQAVSGSARIPARRVAQSVQIHQSPTVHVPDNQTAVRPRFQPARVLEKF